jgi:mycofactocin precursor
MNMEKETQETTEKDEPTTEEPQILKEIIVEELSIDGVCGVY